MARQLDDSEFWLPPQFLTDDDFINGFDLGKNNEKNSSLSEFEPFGFDAALGTSSNSGLSSPGESFTETESDEDDYISGLTRRMVHSTLEENCFDKKNNTRVLDFSGSPKSPLCKPGLNWYGSRCNSGVSTQAAGTALKQNEDAWDLLCAAAGEVARMKMAQESARTYPNNSRHGNGAIFPPRKPSPVSVPAENMGSSVGISVNEPHLSYQQLQAARFAQMRRQQMMKQQQQQQGVDGGVWGNGGVGGCEHFYQVNLNHQMSQRNGSRTTTAAAAAAGLSLSAWPTLQQSQQPQAQAGSGMRALFLGNSSGKRECAGTGVFLPRRIGSPTESRKAKPACSTVLLPDRVVQALNLKLEAVPQPQPQPQRQPKPKYNRNLAPADYDAALKYRSSLVMAQRQNSFRPPHPATSEEVRLPQEWTY